MTAQYMDLVMFQGVEYSVTAIAGSGWFNPADHNLKVRSWSTGVWRGYHSVYEVRDDSLYLIKAHLGLSESDVEAMKQGKRPNMFGVVPHRYMMNLRQYNPKTGAFDEPVQEQSSEFVVEGFLLPIPYTGGIVIGDRFIQEMYVHLGFQSPERFEIVHELIFEHGRLIEENDCSAGIAQIREQTLAIDPPDYKRVRSVIQNGYEQTFKLKY